MRKNQNVKELSTMMLKKLQYIGTRIYSLDTMYRKKERDRGAGWELGRKKERKEKDKSEKTILLSIFHLRLLHWLSRSLFLYSSVSLSLHGFLHHLSGLVSVSISVSTDLPYLLSLLTPLGLSLPFFPALSPSPSLFLFISLLSYSLSPCLYFSLSISLPAYSTTCLSFSNSPFISLSSVWLSISMSVSPFSSTGIKKSCDTSGLASVY